MGASGLVQNYAMVVFEFVPAGSDNPVLALDPIDAGSFPGLRQDSMRKNPFCWWPYAAALAVAGWRPA